MPQFYLNNLLVIAEPAETILQVAQRTNVHIPTLCFLKDINEVAACRVCLVENEATGDLVPACATIVEDGMRIRTNTPAVRAAVRGSVELILANHDCTCATCTRDDNCKLQDLAKQLGIFTSQYEHDYPLSCWDRSLPLIREDSKCIKCLRCVNICRKVQQVGVWQLNETGPRTTVAVKDGRELIEANCTVCGQCITHCPVGALHERDDVPVVLDYLADDKLTTIIQIAPAVRAAWGETFGMAREHAQVERLVTALKQMGFDYVFDTDFGADMTIMEEGSELVAKIKSGEIPRALPMFTSCCPGWVRFVETQYPQLQSSLSTAKSPMQMFGAVSKTYFAEKIGKNAQDLRTIAIMPCTAKKREITLFKGADNLPDVDLVLTTRELDRMLMGDFVDVKSLPLTDFDTPLGESSGAGVIFGTQSGVMEAALRSAHYLITGRNPKADAFSDIRTVNGAWVHAEFTMGKIKLRVATVSGLSNADKLIQSVLSGEVVYDFVEVMACPGGCAGGGGQPICDGHELAEARSQRLRTLDTEAQTRFSHENKSVQQMYQDYLGAPLSARAEELLHTT